MSLVATLLDKKGTEDKNVSKKVSKELLIAFIWRVH